MTTKTYWLIRETNTNTFYVKAGEWSPRPEDAFECDTFMDALSLICLLPPDNTYKVDVVWEEEGETHSSLTLDLYEENNAM